MESGHHCLDLSLISGDFDGESIGADVHGSSAKDLHQVEHIAASFCRRIHFDESQVAYHPRLLCDVVHAQHIDHLVEVGLDPLALIGGGIHLESHAADATFVSTPHVERNDIVTAPSKQRRNSIQNAGLVFHICYESTQILCGMGV